MLPKSEYQFPLMDGHDHVVVAGYSPFTDSQRFRERRIPRMDGYDYGYGYRR